MTPSFLVSKVPRSHLQGQSGHRKSLRSPLTQWCIWSGPWSFSLCQIISHRDAAQEPEVLYRNWCTTWDFITHTPKPWPFWYTTSFLPIKSNQSSYSLTQWEFCCCSFLFVCLFLWVQFSHVWLQPHGLQHARLSCPSSTPKACSSSCPLSPWCHPTISPSVIPFSSCLQSFLALESFPVSWLFASGGQVLELQLQHQTFQWIFRVDFL